MLISNEMRNEPALALRLINGKITPSSSLMKQYTAVYFQPVYPDQKKKKKREREREREISSNYQEKILLKYIFSKPGYSSDLCIYSINPILCCLVAKSCPTLCDPMDCSPARLLCPWDFLGKNAGVGCHFLLHGDLPEPGIEPTSLTFSASAGGFFTTAPSNRKIKTC